MKCSLKRIAIMASLMLVLACTANSDFKGGLAAYERGDYVTAMREWLPLAKQGFASAQHNIGLMYRKGQGVPQDYAKARLWFKKAAVQGYDPAQMNMAILYREGWGVPQDYAAAAEWYRMAALRGNVEGQYNLGVFYWNGTGVSRNRIQAYVWSSLAAVLYPPGRLRDDAIGLREAAHSAMTATQRDVAEREAAFRLGWAYHVGQGTEADPGEALKFYCRSAELGLDAAGFMMDTDSTPELRRQVMAVAVTGVDPLKWATTVATEIDQGLRFASGVDLPSLASVAAEGCRSRP
jgi:TPR repeat protein